MDLRADSDDRLEYRILDVSLAAEIKLNDCSYDESLYLSVFMPSVAGSRTEDGHLVIGQRTYGFDGALKDNLREKLNFQKINVGESGSYSVEGKIIIPVYKGEKSYLILENDADAEELYFCLE